MADSLRNITKKGVYWSAASNIATKGMQFVFSIILARLLTPNDYGVIGMLTIFITIIQLFVDSGFSKAIITKQTRTQKDLSTAFYFNIVVGFVGYFILFLLAPLISKFYDIPILIPVLRVIGLGVIINSLNIIPTALYAINLDFKTPAKIAVTSSLFTGCLGVIMAYCGWEVWALVFQSIGGALLTLILNWIKVCWMPSLEFSKDSFKNMWRYGSRVLCSSIISTTYDNIQPLIIGKFFDASSLGLFSRAQQFANLPSSNLSGVLNNVTFPLLSKINNDIARLADVYRRLVKLTAFFVFPTMMILAVLSAPLIKLLLSEVWYDCIPMLQIICFALIWQPISSINLNLLNAARKPEIVLKLEIIKKVVGLILLFTSIPYGIIIMCYANLLSCIFAVIINTIMTSKALKVSFSLQVKDLMPICFHTLIMGFIVYLTTFLFNSNFMSIIVGGLIGVCYFFFASKFFMNELLQDIIYMVKRKI